MVFEGRDLSAKGQLKGENGVTLRFSVGDLPGGWRERLFTGADDQIVVVFGRVGHQALDAYC